MGYGITISGLDDCLKCFENAPENVVKVTRKALRDASKASSRTLRGRLPKRWRALVKYKVVRTMKGNLNAVFGLFNGKQTQGHQNPSGAPIADWFKAYWINYGTLDNRDPNHQFQRPVKHRETAAAKRRRNTEGIRPRNFFEAGLSGWEASFVEEFQKSMKRNEQDLLER